MTATYDTTTRTYSIEGMDAKLVHVLIWGGTQREVDQAERELRVALLDAEDKQMPHEHYKALFE